MFHFDCISRNMEANDPKPGIIKFKALECPMCKEQVSNEHVDKHPIAMKLNCWKAKVDMLVEDRIGELNEREKGTFNL